MPGPVYLLGGVEFTDAHLELDRTLLAEASTDTVTVLPTAAAYERPERLMERAREHFAGLGAGVEVAGVLTRGDALNEALAEQVAAARLLYLVDGSAMHIEATLKRSPVLDALRAAHQSGATIAASGASARVLCDPMVDPRGGAFAVGFGLVRGVTVVPGGERFSEDREHRTRRLMPGGVELVILPSGSHLRVAGDGSHEVVAG